VGAARCEEPGAADDGGGAGTVAGDVGSASRFNRRAGSLPRGMGCARELIGSDLVSTVTSTGEAGATDGSSPRNSTLVSPASPRAVGREVVFTFPEYSPRFAVTPTETPNPSMATIATKARRGVTMCWAELVGWRDRLEDVGLGRDVVEGSLVRPASRVAGTTPPPVTA